MGRGIAVALALSLGANVFLGGFVAGRIFHADHGRRSPVADFGHGNDAAPPELSDAARDKMRAAFKASKDDFAKAQKESRALHDDLMKILTAETFDRSAAEGVAKKLAAFEGERRARFTAVIINTVDGMSLEDRKALAASFEKRQFGERRPHRRSHFRRDRFGGDAPPPPPADDEGAPPPDGADQ